MPAELQSGTDAGYILVEHQLAAYNRGDIDAFLTCFEVVAIYTIRSDKIARVDFIKA